MNENYVQNYELKVKSAEINWKQPEIKEIFEQFFPALCKNYKHLSENLDEIWDKRNLLKNNFDTL